MDKATYITLQQKIKAGTATPEEIQAVKEYEASVDTRPWYEKEGEAESIIDKYNGQTSADIAAQKITPEQQGTIAKGNQGDNAIANPNAADTSEVTKRALAEKASVQTPDNMEPASFTTNPDDFTKSEKVEEKQEPKTETKAKNKYRNQSMSIWDAYYNGEFGDPDSDEAKNTRNYFIIDALANFAKNTGRSIGNVGAQYSGGTIDEGHDTSQWESVRNTLGSEELQIAKEQLGGPAERRATSELLNNKLTALSANRSATVNDLINEIKAEADKAESETMKKSYLALAAQLAGAGMNNVSLGASAATGLIEDIKNWVKGDNK